SLEDILEWIVREEQNVEDKLKRLGSPFRLLPGTCLIDRTQNLLARHETGDMATQESSICNNRHGIYSLSESQRTDGRNRLLYLALQPSLATTWYVPG